jgi:hypothetical protein
MSTKDALIELSGQIINGMMSSDSSIITKMFDRSVHCGTAKATVNLAVKILEEIDRHLDGKENEQS